MTSEQFVYWLQGFFEITDPKELTPEQTKIIKDHLQLVFNKQTPDYSVTIQSGSELEYCQCEYPQTSMENITMCSKCGKSVKIEMVYC